MDQRRSTPGTGTGGRTAVLHRLARMITGIERPHPVRVGVDGFSAAGKSTLADELAATVADHGRTCLRADLDDFKRPRLNDLQAQLASTAVRSISTPSALFCWHPSGRVGIGTSA